MTDNKQKPYASLPADGLMIWEVHYKSQYFDDDPRMPSVMPVDIRFYVVAGSRDEALSKSKDSLKSKVSKKYNGVIKEVQDHEQIDVSPIALENLVAARDSSNDGRLGWISNSKFAQVQLSLEEDLGNYKLGVCLIPTKK